MYLYSNFVDDKDLGDFRYEPGPSHRTEKFLAATRYDSLREAIEAAEKWLKENN